MGRLAQSIAASLGITNKRVIEAVGQIPRHLFVEEALTLRAYSDDALPIGYGQTISKISTVLRMTDLLDPAESDRILEIGTGSGFQLAVLGLLCKSVYSVERVGALAIRSRQMMNRLRIFGVNIRSGDGSKGWSEHAPFDKIIVTAAAAKLPEPLLLQLAVGGRLVIPVESGERQVLTVVTRLGEDQWEQKTLETCRFVPLVEGARGR
ncbi:protein-L-isoaspartate(D-aspartate) O-methyltransferase [bacterium]|nr:MAG: protein-L-isoaspartate(D-aspartate) O-methyltransferase [bacterium]